MKHVYIAGPFFNPQQVALINMLEATLAEHGIPFFSPMRQGGVINPKSTDLECAKIFKANEDAIRNASLVLAVTEYRLPPNQMLVAMQRTSEGSIETVVHLPDQGTVWETGFANGLGVPVVGYHEPQALPLYAKINVMLSKSFVGFIESQTKLESFCFDLQSATLENNKALFYMDSFLAIQRSKHNVKEWQGRVG